jgi:hypothetical protein
VLQAIHVSAAGELRIDDLPTTRLGLRFIQSNFGGLREVPSEIDYSFEPDLVHEEVAIGLEWHFGRRRTGTEAEVLNATIVLFLAILILPQLGVSG